MLPHCKHIDKTKRTLSLYVFLLLFHCLFLFQFLNSPDYEGRKSEEVGKLEMTILQQKKVTIATKSDIC